MKTPRPKRRPSDLMNGREQLTLSNLGIAAERALYYWHLLPLSVKAFYDADDMIADVVLHIYQKAGEHDPSRSRPSTFVHHVATMKCRDIVAHYRAIKRGATITVAIEDRLKEADLPRVEAYADADRNDESESLNVVERVIKFSPDYAREILAGLFGGNVQRGLPSQETLDILKQVVKGQSATRRDFDTVLRCFATA